MKERRGLIDRLVDFVSMEVILLFLTSFTSDCHLVDEKGAGVHVELGNNARVPDSGLWQTIRRNLTSEFACKGTISARAELF